MNALLAPCDKRNEPRIGVKRCEMRFDVKQVRAGAVIGWEATCMRCLLSFSSVAFEKMTAWMAGHAELKP